MTVLLPFLIVSTISVAQTSQPVKIQADSLAGAQINGEPVKQFFGHVQFVQGSLYGSADKATEYLVQQKVELTGNVEIHQDTLSLYAPHVTYSELNETGYADGGVRMFDRDEELTAHEADYNMGTEVAHFYHHVTVTQDKNTSVSDSMTYYRSTMTSILYGHASVTSDSGSMTADTIANVRSLGQTTAKGNVHLWNDTLRLASDWLYDSRLTGELYTRGHVRAEDIPNETIIFSDTMARFTKGNYMLFPKRPLLLYYDSSQVRDSDGIVRTKFDTMFVRADTMRLYQGDSARFYAIDSVRLIRKDFSLSGGELIYDEAHDLMTVFHSKRQHLWNDSTEIDADSVSMHLKEHHLDKVCALGHSFATSPMAELPNSGRVDQLQGDNMLLIVTKDTVRELFSMDDALSIYFILNDEKPDGLNRLSADTIRMDFKDKKVVRVAGIYGPEGEYFPERFVTGRAKAFRLNAYERHDELRPKREEFVRPWEETSLVIPAHERAEIPLKPKS